MTQNTNNLVCDAIYVQNMTALFKVDARLAQRIDECIDDGSVQVEVARRGSVTAAVVPAEGGRPIWLHSKVDPVSEAERWASAVQIGEDFCYIVGGYGLGHHVKALHARLKGEAFLIVTEPNLQLLRIAMETIDLTELFENDRCVILTQVDKSELQQRLDPHNTLMMMGTQFVSHAASDRANKAFHASLRKLIADHMTYCRMSIVTLVANARITCQNIANNFPRYLSTPPIDVLYNRFEGIPAVIVSAGPSLSKNINQLADLQDKAVICAVQTTFKPLLKRGIQPHFVTSLDYHEISRRYFEGIDDDCGTHLVAEPKASWHVIDQYQGPISILDSLFARQCLGDKLAARSGLKAGATVAHLAFYLAVYMGCDPIVLIGQDLGYTNHVYYAPGVPFHDMWRPDLNRFNTIEMKEWERLARNRKILIETKDVEGRAIYTDEQLFTYLQQFEADFALVPGRVIDATEGGVRKSGTRVMPLAEAAKTYCGRRIDPQLFSYLDELNWHNTSRLQAGRDAIDDRLQETDEMLDTCREMLAVLKDLQGLIDQPKAFNRRLVEVDRLRLKVRAHERVYHIISSLSQHAELQRISADSHLTLEDMDHKDRAKRQLERDIRFVEAFIDGAGSLQDIFNGSRERFDRAMSEDGG